MEPPVGDNEMEGDDAMVYNEDEVLTWPTRNTTYEDRDATVSH